MWVAGWLVAPGFAAAQEVGTLRGVVVEYGTRRPVAGVQVAVLGTDRTAVTDQAGRYQLVVPAGGELMVRVHGRHYAATIELIHPVADAINLLDFTLAGRVHVLSALDIQAPKTQSERGVLNEPEVDRAASLADVLDGVSGVQLIRSGGDVGRGYRLRIRGAKSFTFSQTPVVYVDGARVEVVSTRGGSGILELLDINTIGRVEVLRGPAATARYGTGGMNGVIIVTTKRGR